MSPPMLVTAAKAAVVRFSDSAGVLVPKCDGALPLNPPLPGRSSTQTGQLKFPGQLLERIRGFFVPFPTYAAQRIRR